MPRIDAVERLVTTGKSLDRAEKKHQKAFDRVAQHGIKIAREAFHRVMPGLRFRLDLKSEETNAALPNTEDNIRYDHPISWSDPEYKKYASMELTDATTGTTFRGFNINRHLEKSVLFQVRVPLTAFGKKRKPTKG